MKTLGLRASPTSVTFAVYDCDKKSIHNVEDIYLPKALFFPDRLKYLRSNLLDVLREYQIMRAGVRVTEPNAQRPNVERIQIEGVIQEAFASSLLDKYYIGQISSISKRLGVNRTRFKPMVAGEDDPGVENWSDMTKEAREAILCAMGAEHA